MRRRATYIHDPSVDINPEEIQVTEKQLLIGGLRAAREERLTFGYDELPAELWEVLKNAHELHIRWVPERRYDVITPFLSRISPGLHVHYTPLPGGNDDLLCPMLQKIFSPGLKCKSPNATFIIPPVVSERFATTSNLQYHSLLPSLSNMVAYIQRQICQRSDLSCAHTASLLNIVDSFDIDYDSISHTLVMNAFWSKPPAVFYDPVGEFTTYEAWNIDVKASDKSKIEVGILSPSPATDSHDLQLSGFLTVVGEDDHPKPTLFYFPSRHHALVQSQSQTQRYSVSFLQPPGLHPTLQISFPSASALTIPSNRPTNSQCALQVYMTMPSSIFVDEYVFTGADSQFQETHKIRQTASIAGERDLEAPDYLIHKWGSTLLFEPAIPSTTPSLTGKPVPDGAWNVTVPLHLRYLAPSAGGTLEVEMPWPIVYWACTAEEGTKFPVNPFDRTQLGFEGLYGPRTMFYHLEPQPGPGASGTDGRLVEKLTVPVYDTTAAVGAEAVEWGTVVVVLAGFVWVVLQLWPELSRLIGVGRTVEAETEEEEKKKKKRQ